MISDTLPREDRRPKTAKEPPSPTARLWQHYAKSGPGSPSENDLVKEHLSLVKTVVGRLAMTLPAHVDREDLYSAGLVGLLNAVRRYDPTCGTSFGSYARVRIRGAVLDELRRMDWIPRSVHTKARKVEEVMRELEQRYGRLPTEDEMAEALDLSPGAFQTLLNQIQPATFICLDSVRSREQGERATQYEGLADDHQPSPGEDVARQELKKLIAERIKQLPDAQRKVLALYYFEDLRLWEIAEAFGVTESRICQIHAQAIQFIKASLRRQDPLVI